MPHCGSMRIFTRSNVIAYHDLLITHPQLLNRAVKPTTSPASVASFKIQATTTTPEKRGYKGQHLAERGTKRYAKPICFSMQ